MPHSFLLRCLYTISFLLLLIPCRILVAQGDNTLQSFYIVSQPAGASIYMNNQWIARTPYQINILPGIYSVRIDLENYFVYEERIDIVKGDDMQVLNVSLKIKPATLIIKTEQDVIVSIDGEQASLGSYETEIDPGRHRITFSGELYSTVIKDIRLQADEKKTVEFVPEKLFGELEIRTKPKAASLLLNGKNIGTAPIILNEVRIGENHLKAKLEGYSMEERDVVVENTKTTVVKIKLQKLDGFKENSEKEVPTERDEAEMILPLSKKDQDKRDKRYEVRNPFSWKYHMVALDFVLGVSGYGPELAYLNKIGFYALYTMGSPAIKSQFSPKKLSSFGGGVLIREGFFGKRNRGAVYLLAGFGKELDNNGHYFDIGQYVNFGRVTMSFGMSRMYFTYNPAYFPYNDELKIRFGMGVAF